MAKKIVQDNRDKRKTQTVRLNFIKISLNLSVFFIYWLVFAQPPLLRVRVNISAQWLIVRFVRVSHSKSDHYDCCEQSSPYLQPQTVSQTV
ncbi:hypothetical protein [Streptococcus suis]|uniref:hypothetical protein n=1 Tax=Streptococcus suis TaxID=1307 RepID=UPI0020BE584E|nr:hypothetical protein [Streptococcus suis]